MDLKQKNLNSFEGTSNNMETKFKIELDNYIEKYLHVRDCNGNRCMESHYLDASSLVKGLKDIIKETIEEEKHEEDYE